jgi:hypothetical protein
MVGKAHDVFRAAPLVDEEQLMGYGSEQAGGRPVIYCFILLPEPGGGGMVIAMSQAGRTLASDHGRTEFDCRKKIGLGSLRHHPAYAAAHPEGYMLTWVDNPTTDPELNRVIRINMEINEMERKL